MLAQRMFARVGWLKIASRVALCLRLNDTMTTEMGARPLRCSTRGGPCSYPTTAMDSISTT